MQELFSAQGIYQETPQSGICSSWVVYVSHSGNTQGELRFICCFSDTIWTSFLLFSSEKRRMNVLCQTGSEQGRERRRACHWFINLLCTAGVAATPAHFLVCLINMPVCLYIRSILVRQGAVEGYRFTSSLLLVVLLLLFPNNWRVHGESSLISILGRLYALCNPLNKG